MYKLVAMSLEKHNTKLLLLRVYTVTKSQSLGCSNFWSEF